MSDGNVIVVRRADITTVVVDAIVNAANESLLGGGDSGEPALLAACYRESLRLAAAERVASLAFPAISCGVYGYPAELASRVAVRAVRDWLVAEPMPRAVVFCCPGADMARAFEEALAAA